MNYCLMQHLKLPGIKKNESQESTLLRNTLKYAYGTMGDKDTIKKAKEVV